MDRRVQVALPDGRSARCPTPGPTGVHIPPARRGTQHSGSIARAGGRAIDPLAVLEHIRATLKEFGDTKFDATHFVTTYGRLRGREVLVHDASLAARGLEAETWICETYDIIRVERRLPRPRRDMTILVQWAYIHYSTDPECLDVAASFDVLADAVQNHRATSGELKPCDLVY
jgi:hypothetical protein